MNTEPKLTISAARREQFTNPATYAAQLINIVSGLMRALGYSIALTVILTCGVLFWVYQQVDISAYSVAQHQQFVGAIVVLTGVPSVLLCVLFNTGRFEDVFEQRAMEKLERYQRIESEVRTIRAIVNQVLTERAIVPALTAGDDSRPPDPSASGEPPSDVAPSAKH